MTSAGVDTVFYGGYYNEAAKLVTQLRDAGFEGNFVSGDGSLDIGFIKNAGEAGNGAYLTATGAPPTSTPSSRTTFKTKFGSDPGLYSPESYDIAHDLPRTASPGQDHPGGHGRLRVGLRHAGHHQAASASTRRVSWPATPCSTRVVEDGKISSPRV